MGETACKAKIIIDGDNVSGLLSGFCEATANLSDAEVAMLTDEKAYPIIEKLIKMEKLATECQDLLLDAIGYDGPRPKFFK
jgi:hypothetical protein